MADNKRPGNHKNKLLMVDATGQNRVEFGLMLGQRCYSYKSKFDYHNREELIVALERFLYRKNVMLKDLTGLVVVKGPGPYTAVRVSAAIANALHLSLRVPLYAVTKTENIAIKKVLEKVRLGKIGKIKFVKPVYSNPPNITKPKKISKKKLEQRVD